MLLFSCSPLRQAPGDAGSNSEGHPRSDSGGPGCQGCHGAAANLAPPVSVSGASATSQRGVGAHQAHLAASTWHATVQCSDCHVVPTAITDKGHIDTALPAEVTFSAIASAGGAQPSWDGTKCSGTYCHGASLSGGTLTAPTWTTVDGSQAACGTCHGLPPSGHPGGSCATCHSKVVDASQKIIAPELHLNGKVDVDDIRACNLCHGSLTNDAPPVSTTGKTSTSDRGVGAHQAHLQSSSWHVPGVCSDCHKVPSSVDDPGHDDTPLPAEVLFSAAAKARNAQPAWNGTTCTGTYCHGATLSGGAATAPVWTKVDGTQKSCTACHGMPPTANGHTTSTLCSTCHAAVVDSQQKIIAPALHINGLVESGGPHPTGWATASAHGPPFFADPASCGVCHGATLTGGAARSCAGTGCHSATWTTTCTFCHGGTDNLTGAPPRSLDGQTATSAPGVGRHTSHVTASTTHIGWDCTACHPKPVDIFSTGHVGPPPADVTFTGVASGGSYNLTTHTCTLYCHGDGKSGSTGSAVWTGSLSGGCSACHDDSTDGLSMTLSGDHMQHIVIRKIGCNECHSCMINASKQITAAQLHVNGARDVCGTAVNWDPAAKTCTTTCHIKRTW